MNSYCEPYKTLRLGKGDAMQVIVGEYFCALYLTGEGPRHCRRTCAPRIDEGEAVKPKCSCPIYCKYCGAKRKRDMYGHLCGTRNCQWEYGFMGCTDRNFGKVKP